MKSFYSQQGEDVYIYNNFINKVCPDGIFVELGAMDGICYSNTKFFEDELQMTGTLIEPTNQYYSLIHNRPKCKCYNLAVNNTKDKVKFLGDGPTAGMVDTMSESFKNHWHKNNNNEYYVDGEPISDILDKSDIKYIDLITIDVEGGEEVVLKTLNYNIPIYVICVELDGNNKDKHERCRQILLEKGFTFNKRMCINEFWVNNNYFRKDLLYNETLPKIKFQKSIYEIGNFHCLASHVVEEVEKSLQ
jgi:FkbM family methyltransferase